MQPVKAPRQIKSIDDESSCFRRRSAKRSFGATSPPSPGRAAAVAWLLRDEMARQDGGQDGGRDGGLAEVTEKSGGVCSIFSSSAHTRV
jgi:hypothetical protein